MTSRMTSLKSWLRRFTPGQQAGLWRSVERLGRRQEAVQQALAALRKEDKRERKELHRQLRTGFASIKKSASRNSNTESAVERLGSRVEDVVRRLDEISEDVRVSRMASQQMIDLAATNREWRDKLDDLRGLLDVRTVTAHVKHAVEGSRLEQDPVPHVAIDHVLPPQVYEAVVACLPPRTFFEDLNGQKKREVVLPMRYGPDASLLSWDLMHEITHRALVPALLQKFDLPLRNYIRAAFPRWNQVDDELISRLTFIKEQRIFLRGPGYVFRPHRDPKFGFISCLVYLARPNDREEFGTDLYAVDRDDVAQTDGVHYPEPSRCRQVQTVPFRANTSLAFLNGSGAHGASVPSDAGPVTERYLYSIRFGPDKRTRDGLAAAATTTV